VPFNKFDDVIKALTNGHGNLYPVQKAIVASLGVAMSTWPSVGLPNTGTYPGVALAAAQQDNTTPGGIAFPNPPSGMTRHLLHFLMGGAGSATTGILYLLDRLLVYPAISHTINTLQTFANPVTLPRYTDGVGVMAFLEVTTLIGTGTPTVTLNYINHLGQAAVTTFSAVNALAVGSLMPAVTLYIPLAAGDLGIRQATSIQFSAGQSAGVSALVLARPLGSLPVLLAGNLATRDWFTQVPSLERIYDSHCLMMAGIFTANINPGNYVGQILSAYN
jgi:hypothetical protein